MKRLIALASLALASTAFAGSTNLLLNPSFEDLRSPLKGGGFQNWDFFGNISADENVEIIANDGMVSVKSFGNFFGPGIQSDTGILQTVSVPDAAGKTFRATISAYSPSTDPIAPLDFTDPDGNGSFGHLPLLLLQYGDGNGNTLSQPEVRVFDPTIDPLDTWVTYSVEGLAPAGTVEITIFALLIQFGDDPGTLFWDSAVLEETEGTDMCEGTDPAKLFEDSSAPWNGFMNVFELDQTTYVFGSDWGIADLTATFDDGVPSVTMGPAPIDDPDPFWYVGGGAPGAEGNKHMEALLFQETLGCLAGQNVTFSGYVHENTLTEDHDAVIFIRDFAPDFSSFNESTAPATPGEFNISLPAVDDPARTVQWGFAVRGPNVWPSDAASFGTVTFSSVPGSFGCNDADIAEPYGILDLSDISSFVSAFTGMAAEGDINDDGIWDLTDITLFINAFTGGCP